MIQGLGNSLTSFEGAKKNASQSSTGQALSSFSEHLEKETSPTSTQSFKRAPIKNESQNRKQKSLAKDAEAGDQLPVDRPSPLRTEAKKNESGDKPMASSDGRVVPDQQREPSAHSKVQPSQNLVQEGSQGAPALDGLTQGQKPTGELISPMTQGLSQENTLRNFTQLQTDLALKPSSQMSSSRLAEADLAELGIGTAVMQNVAGQDESALTVAGGLPVFLKSQQSKTQTTPLSSPSSEFNSLPQRDLGQDLQNNVILSQELAPPMEMARQIGLTKNPILKNGTELATNQLVSEGAVMPAENNLDSLLKPLSGLASGQLLGGEDKQDSQADSGLQNLSGIETQAGQVARDFASEMIQETQKPSLEPQIQNMKEVVDHARAMVKEGGGEMQIHLQPEGLGKIQLKVAVQDGRVQIEMMTDNNQARKALEEGLFEVKAALESQRLFVDTLKVDMSPDYQRDFTDLRDHLQEQANREFAQDFMEQFRQDRQARMGGLLDRFQQFSPGHAEPELKLAGRNPYAEQGKGRTLNLVA